MADGKGRRTLRVFVELSVCEGDQTDTPLGHLIDEAMARLAEQTKNAGALAGEGVVVSVDFPRSDCKPTVHGRIHYVNEYGPKEKLNLFVNYPSTDEGRDGTDYQ